MAETPWRDGRKEDCLDMVSLFAIPKPFEGHVGTIQMNAVRSWVAFRPHCEVILLGDERGTAEVAARFGLRHFPDVSRNEHGTPLLNSVFAQAERYAAHDILCYVNADIILMDDLLTAVARLAREQWPALIIGRRWDLNLEEEWEFDRPASAERLRTLVRTCGRPHACYAMDYFVFPRGLWQDIPPFAIGRTLWDNWLVWRAWTSRMPIIDASEAITAIHQNHNYSHLPGGEVAVWQGSEAQRNLQLLGGLDHILDLRDVTWILTATDLRPARSIRRLVRRASHARPLRPFVRPLQIVKRSVQEARRRVRVGMQVRP